VQHILFGTLVFSSLTFIAVADAVPVAARYMGSAIVCRGILMFELSGMRETTAVKASTVIQDDSLGLRNMAKSALMPKACDVSMSEFHHVSIPENEM
jgi:hypothetical protein